MAHRIESRTTERIAWALFAAVTVLIYFFGLSIPLLGPDEPRYSQVAREMFERADWITPTLGGSDWFEKPALLYWLQIVSYRLFGVTEFAARFGSALFGLGTIAALYILGKQWKKGVSEADAPSAEEQKREASLAYWLLLVAASSIGLIVFSRGASFDIILTFPVTAALVSFFIFELGEIRFDNSFGPAGRSPIVRHAALASFYFFIGVALIGKGLVGIVFPFAIVGFYYVLSLKFPSRPFLFSLVWGTPLALVVACAWYLPMYRVNGWKFIDEFIIQHHFQRYSSNKYQHPQPFWFFWVVLPLMTIPWIPFFFAEIWKTIRHAVGRIKGHGDPESPLTLFAVSWMLVPVVFFSASGSKLPGYILPAVPGALILAALAVQRFARGSKARKNGVMALGFITFAVIAAIITWPLRDWAGHETVRELVAAGDAAGLHDARILNLHTVTHNLEFYGAGRLVRDFEGRQRRFEGITEIASEIEKAGGKPVLVVVPLEYRKQLEESPLVRSRILTDNGELAIAEVNANKQVQ